jgi:hypothetical protein
MALESSSDKQKWNQPFSVLNGPPPKRGVKRHLYNLLNAWPPPSQHTDPSWPIDESLLWPYSSGNDIAYEINQQLGPPEQSQQDLVARLSDIEYPYPVGNKKHSTFYDHLKKQDILRFVIEPPFLWKVRMVWWWRKAYEIDVELKKRGMAKSRLPVKLHRSMMNLIFAHHSRVEELCETYGVIRQQWTAEYLAALNRQFLREAVYVYPEAGKRLVPALQLHDHRPGSTPQLEIYRSIIDIQKRCGKKRNKTLARQLTALICSSAESIREHNLEPNPEAVRQSLFASRKRP